MTPATFTQWRTSSYSSGDPDNCVEVGATPDQRAVRDTKLGPASPVLTFTLANWQAFTSSTKRNEFDQPR
jgi:hypothetical protein